MGRLRGDDGERRARGDDGAFGERRRSATRARRARLASAKVDGVASESLVSLRSVKRRHDVRRVRAVNTEVDEKELASLSPRRAAADGVATESGAVALETNQSNVLAEPKDESNNLGFAVATAFLFGLVVMGVVYREDLFALDEFAHRVR